MYFKPIGELRTHVSVGDVISLFVTAKHRFFVESVTSDFESSGLTGQHVELRRIGDYDGSETLFTHDGSRSNITITDKPIATRTDYYTRVYVHGHFDTLATLDIR